MVPNLASIFPSTKIKSHILRDEGVGRISSKAVQLIGACSAIFVRDLARAASQEVATNPENGRTPGTLDEESNTKSSSRSTSRVRNDCGTKLHPRKRLRTTDARTAQVTLDLHHVSRCIESDDAKYDFLHDLVREVTEESAPSLNESVRKKPKVHGKSAPKKTGNSGDRGDLDVMAKIPHGSSGRGAGGEVECEALRTVIADALLVPDSHGGIVEDDDEYD